MVRVRALMTQKATENSADPRFGRRDLLRVAAAGVVAAAVAGTSVNAGQAAVTAGENNPAGAGIRAFKLYAGPDHASHALEGTIDEKERTEVIAIHFKETPAHSVGDWHESPELQYVITLSGTLEFTTRNGETFVVRPGDVLLSEDNVGTGHRWRLIDDQPWRRAYVVLKPGTKDSFVAKTTQRGLGPMREVK
jgi:quercetin dioxygenase-like cupin family protein